MNMKILFTDLDGTLLDKNYDWKKAIKEIDELKKRNIPIIFCSAKTKAEQEKIRKEIGINDPYIVEDGSAIVIPKDSELHRLLNLDYEMIKLGTDYNKILNFLKKFKGLKYYGNMDINEISKVTGLSLEDAKLAKKREFSETIVKWNDKAIKEIEKKFKVRMGGKFLHVYGKETDKGKAVKILTELYSKAYNKRPKTFGIGNHYTDVPMLKSVDFPAIVKNPEGWIDIKMENLYKAKGIATEGWREVVKKLILKI